jgi:multisubunit Na+/H+ antiporter MnhB subunit
MLGDIISVGDSVGTATPAPPGWYSDPSGANPGTLRWWDGATWTEHVHVVQPLAPNPQVFPPRALQAQFAPVTADPRNGVEASNRPGRTAALLALVFASVSVAVFIAFELSPGPTFLAAFFAAPAIILAVRSLTVRRGYRPRGSTVPVVALSVGVVTLLAGLILPIGGAVPTIPRLAAAQQTTIYPHNAEMTKMAMNEFTIERAIRANASPGNWPASVVADAQNNVVVDGAIVATLQPGETLSYQVTQDGADFVLVLNGTVQNEYIYYDYSTHTIKSFCAKTDLSCADAY